MARRIGDEAFDRLVVGGLGPRHELRELPVALRGIRESHSGIVLVAVFHQMLNLRVRESDHVMTTMAKGRGVDPRWLGFRDPLVAGPPSL